MAKRSRLREIPGTPKVAVHVAQPAGTSGQEAWVNTMVQASEHVSQFLDRKAIKKGKEEGLKAGKDFKETGGTSLYDQAYDAAGREGYKAAMGNKIAESMADIYRANKHDPKALQEKLDSYEREIIGQAESHSPEAALNLKAMSSRQKLSYLDTSRNTAESALIDESAAEATAGLNSIVSSTQFAVRNMRDRESAMTFAAHSRAQYEAALVSNGRKEPFADDKSLYLSEAGRKLASEPSPDRTGVFSAKDIQAALKKFDDTIVTEKYMWGMDEAIKVGKPLEYIKAFTDNPNPHLTPDQSKAIKANMYSALSEHSKQITANDTAEKNAREALHRATEQAFTASALRGELSPTQIHSAVEKGDLKASTGRTLATMIKGGGPQESDGMALMMYQYDGLLEYSEEEIMKDGRLTYADRTSMVEKRQNIEADQNDWRNSPSGQEGARRIKGELGIISGNSFMAVSEEKARAATRAQAEYWNEVNALPIEKRATEAPRIADRIVEGIKLDNDKKALVKAEDKLAALPYQTIEGLDAAVESGAEGVTAGAIWKTKVNNVYNEHKRLLERQNKKIAELKARVGK